MQTCTTVSDIQEQIALHKQHAKTIGFVPTMGALHRGHIELLKKCKSDCDIAVCSIFVNPLQFSNREDFVQYPSTLDADLLQLAESGCDLLFLPGHKEVYPEEIHTAYDFGKLEQVMEGRFRPGHFRGMAIVVKRLFDIVCPDTAYFGEKDYQQLLIIRKLVELHNLDMDIIACPTVRESDGLAMSSRNMRLTAAQRTLAPGIYQALTECAGMANQLPPQSLTEFVWNRLREIEGARPEYFELADAATLEPVTTWEKGQEVVACTAVYFGEVRLIDNIRFTTSA
jgi:pantoate--beta-alanine ligase